MRNLWKYHIANDDKISLWKIKFLLKPGPVIDAEWQHILLVSSLSAP